ncbi:hypothetical protein RE2895_61190 (plasmid) [Rhodococcus erythropolis]|nr:hypothetical protein RE2895_61190 [Rhodococcus erythropolis]
MMETWTEWGVERNTLDGIRTVAPMQSQNEAEHVASMWDTSTGIGPLKPIAVSRTVTASTWAPVIPAVAE